MVNETLNSVREMIDGLAYNTPILISVDGMKDYSDMNRTERLQGYIENLRARFQDDPYVTILNNYKFGHISNSIRLAMKMVHTEFVYVLQHDFKFIRPIDHTSLVNVMKENPEQIQIVRFNKSRRAQGGSSGGKCAMYYHFESEKYGIVLDLAKWSDNNHFTTKRYYNKVLDGIGPVPRPVEFPMMASKILNATSDCTRNHQYLYNVREGPHIQHLDGKFTAT